MPECSGSSQDSSSIRLRRPAPSFNSIWAAPPAYSLPLFDAPRGVTYRNLGRLAAAGHRRPSCSPALVVDMDENLRVTAPVDAWLAALAHTIEQQRRRAGERISGQRQRLKDLEGRVAKQLEEATQELARQQDNTKQKEQSLAQREQETKRQRRHVAQQTRAKRKDLTAEAELHRAQTAAAGSGQDMQLQSRLSELQGKYDRLREELDSRQAQRDEANQRLAELRTQLDARQQEAKQHQAALEQAHRKQADLEAERKRLQ